MNTAVLHFIAILLIHHLVVPIRRSGVVQQRDLVINMDQSMDVHLVRGLLLLLSIRRVIDRLVWRESVHLAFTALVSVAAFGLLDHDLVAVIDLHRVGLLHRVPLVGVEAGLSHVPGDATRVVLRVRGAYVEVGRRHCSILISLLQQSIPDQLYHHVLLGVWIGHFALLVLLVVGVALAASWDLP